MLRAQAERTNAAAAIYAPGRIPLSYAQLWEQVDRAATILNQCGLGRENPVAIVLPNGPEMAVAFLAVSSVATSAPLNPDYRSNEFDFYLGDLGAKALILAVGSDSPARAVAEARGIPVIELSPGREAEAGTFELKPQPTPVPAGPVRGGFSGPDDVALVLHTSGTTSRPKMVPLTHRNLCASARHICATLALGPEDRCLNVMPLFHIHGLVAALLSSLAGGGSVVCPPGFYAPKFFGWLEIFHPTWYSAVPTMHQAILARARDHEGLLAKCQLRFLRTSSAALAPQLMAELERTFRAPVIEAYGMTEAAHQMASNPLPPGERKPGSVGRAAGPEVAIMDETGRLLPAGDVGEIVIRGPNVMAGYAANRAANAQAFTNGWFRTGDQGRLDADHYLFITGRLKEIINRGGEKISPREVDEVLLSHGAVAQAVTFAMPDSKLGEEVAATVVLRQNASATEAEIQEFAATRLAACKVPRRVVILDEIPKGPTGKLQRIGLAEKLGLAGARRAEGGPESLTERTSPRTAVEEKLVRIWSEVLGMDCFGVTDNFFHLGGDSVLAAQVLARIRGAFGVQPSVVTFFNGPTVTALAEHIQCLSATARPGVNDAIEPVARTAPLALSSAQQRLWFLDRFEPHNPAYNRPVALRLRGPLDRAALERSLAEIVRRHEALRTCFPEKDGRPVTRVLSASEMELPCSDLRATTEEGRLEEVKRLASIEARQKVDLASGPLLKARLLRLGGTDHVLLFVFHHIVFDGWSADVLRRELAAHYTAFSRGATDSPLAALAIQYRDYAHWEQQQLQGEAFRKDLAWWRRQLAGELPVLELSTNRPRPPALSGAGARHTHRLPASLPQSLRAAGQREGATLFMMLLAAFKVLLHRYTGQEDLIVGCPVAGRSRTETENLIGVFVNTLALRTDLAGNLPFREFLAQVRRVAVEAYARQDVPFEKLVEALQLQRTLNRTPVFQVAFQLRNLPVATMESSRLPSHPHGDPEPGSVSPVEAGILPPGWKPGLTGSQGWLPPRVRSMEKGVLQVEEFDFDPGTAKFDLSLDIVERADGLHCSFEYSTDVFEAATIERMAGHYQTLLESIVAAPETRVGELTILSEKERQQLLVEWSGCRTEYPRDRCVHELFEAQAARNPNALALVCGDQRITYAELDRRANQLARHLRVQGIVGEAPVGLCVARSPELIVGMLGILKAGGAYLPLNPDDPPERRAFMLAEAQAPVVLTQADLRSKLPTIMESSVFHADLPAGHDPFGGRSYTTPTCSPNNGARVTRPSEQRFMGRRIVCLDSDHAVFATQPTDDVRSGTTADSLAYIMYTSGSTGRPKGVCVPHRGIVRLVRETNYAQFTPADVFLHLAPLAFDASTFEVWGALLNGARLVILPGGRPSLEELGEAIRRHGVTTLFLTTGLFNLMVDDRLADLQRLRLLITGGEVMSARHAAKFLEVPGRCRLINGYGPTENTTFTTCYPVTDTIGSGASVPVGRPIANTQVYIVDSRLQPVPVGVPGELCVAGDGLARGYLNRPELTARVFVPHPFSREAGALLYRTGDLARWRADGNIEFLGRIDRQVKIRGFRVEPGEIEAALGEHPSVAEAAVVIQTDAAGNKCLVAHVEARERQSPTTGDLRDFLRTRLPDYLVPTFIVWDEKLPRSASGKVERGALRQHVPAPFQPERHMEPAHDELEQTLVAIWEKHLGVRPVGVRDNFFGLGGNSLLALSVFSDVAKQTGTAQPLSILFQAPTIEQLAALLCQEGRVAVTGSIVAIQPNGPLPPLFCVPGAGVDALCYRDLARHLGQDQPFYGLTPPGFDGRQQPMDDLPALAAFFLREIRGVQPHGPYRIGGLSFGGMVAWEMACQLRAEGDVVALLVLFDTYGPGLGKGLSGENGRGAAGGAGEFTYRLLQKTKLHSAMVAHLPSGQRWPYLRDKARRRLGMIFRRGNTEPASPLEQNARRVYSAHLRALHAYQPAVYPGRVTLFRGRLHLTRRASRDLELGWSGLALGGIEVHDLPGFHHLMVAEPFVRFAAAELRACLAAVRLPVSELRCSTPTEQKPDPASA